jgi:hypothetical protein
MLMLMNYLYLVMYTVLYMYNEETFTIGESRDRLTAWTF